MLLDRILIEWPLVVSSCSVLGTDGTIHNLNDYMEIKAVDVHTNNNVDVKDAIFSRKLGLVTNDLEEFFSQIP